MFKKIENLKFETEKLLNYYIQIKKALKNLCEVVFTIFKEVVSELVLFFLNKSNK